MDVYLINLDRAPERERRIRDLLADSRLKLHRVRAIDGERLQGRDYPAPPRDGALPAERTLMSRFEIALVLGHRRAWRLFLRSGESHAVVLEDDVYFGDGFADFLHNPDWRSCPYDVIKLETIRVPVITSRRDRRDLDGRRIERLLTTHMGAAGYIVTREAARRLLKLSAGAPVGMDSILFDFDRMRASRLPPLRIGQIVPGLVIQHDAHRDPPARDAMLASVIGDRRGRRLGHARPTGGKILREIARPFQRLWRSLRYRTVEFR